MSSASMLSRTMDHAASSAMRERTVVRPMRLRRGDVFTDEGGEWEVVSRPSIRGNEKIVWAKVRRPRDESGLKIRLWGAHELITVMRRVDFD